MTDKELIKQEIERRFNDNMKASEQYTEKSKSRALFTSAAKEDYDLLAFIDSLPEEPKCIYNRTFEERKETCKYCSAACSVRIEEEPASKDLEEEVSNWRHNHFHGRRDKDASGEYLERESQLDLARHFAEWQKQQMMKDAMEGEYWIGEIHLDTPIIQGYNDGDIIKFIPIKYEQQ